MRIDSLTGVRIIAALGVFLSHVSVTSFLPDLPRTFMQSGFNGVTLFFTLSGFVLAWNYADRMATLTGRAVWSFTVARFARIYPLYLFALGIALVPHILDKTVDSSIVLHVLALQTWSPDLDIAFGFNGPAWSIGVEFFLYACFPLLIVVIARLGRSGLLWLLAISVAVVFALALVFTLVGAGDLAVTDPDSAHRWLYRTPVTRLGDFVVGIVAALLIRRGAPVSPRLAYAAQATGAISMVVLMCIEPLQRTAWSWDALYLIPTFLLLWGLAAGSSSVLARFLGSKPMVLLGEASFAFYLLHVPMLARFQGWVIDSPRSWWFVTAVELVIILLVAVGAHVLVERPAQRWLRSKLDRGRSRASAPMVPDELETVAAPEASPHKLDT